MKILHWVAILGMLGSVSLMACGDDEEDPAPGTGGAGGAATGGTGGSTDGGAGGEDGGAGGGDAGSGGAEGGAGGAEGGAGGGSACLLGSSDETCNDCIQTQCEDTCATCSAEAECVALFQCVVDSTTEEEYNQCLVDHAAGINSALGFQTCVGDNCATECPQ